jgi:hypothetical protein
MYKLVYRMTNCVFKYLEGQGSCSITHTEVYNLSIDKLNKQANDIKLQQSINPNLYTKGRVCRHPPHCVCAPM